MQESPCGGRARQGVQGTPESSAAWSSSISSTRGYAAVPIAAGRTGQRDRAPVGSPGRSPPLRGRPGEGAAGRPRSPRRRPVPPPPQSARRPGQQVGPARVLHRHRSPGRRWATPLDAVSAPLVTVIVVAVRRRLPADRAAPPAPAAPRWPATDGGPVASRRVWSQVGQQPRVSSPVDRSCRPAAGGNRRAAGLHVRAGAASPGCRAARRSHQARYRKLRYTEATVAGLAERRGELRTGGRGAPGGSSPVRIPASTLAEISAALDPRS